MKRITDEEIEELSRSFYTKYQGHGLSTSEVMELHRSEYWDLIFAKQLQADKQALKDSREKILRIIKNSRNDKNYVFDSEHYAAQIIQMLLGEEE